MTAEPLRIGTRGSDLALWQAHAVKERLAHPSTVNIITTKGDRLQDISLQGQSTTGFFVRDIEQRLLAGEIDLAVHSFKDLPTQLDPRLEIAACLPRAAVTDLLLVHPDWLDESADTALPLRRDCRVGAGSLRRQALVRLYCPNARPDLIRGNVPTRVAKCVHGDYGAVVLARAGVERLALDWAPLVAFELNVDNWLPAPAQGAVAVEVRRDDLRTRTAVAGIDDARVSAAVALERHLLASFEGGCHTAFGAHAVAGGTRWRVAIGIDLGERGWGQMTVEGEHDRCAAVGPEALDRFLTPAPASREELCRPWSG